MGAFDAVDTTKVGQSFKYQLGTISSCTSTCSVNTDCLPPANSVNGFADGKYWYAYGTQGYWLACLKEPRCVQTDALGRCTNTTQFGTCQVSTAFSTGSCSQNSDCGDTSRFKCDFNRDTRAGTCKPIGEVPTQTCSWDFQCQQVAVTCNARQMSSGACTLGACTTKITSVGCCNVADCAATQFCNANKQCEDSPTQLMPECARPNPPSYCKLCPAGTHRSGEACVPDAFDWMKILAAIIGGFIIAFVLLIIVVIAGYIFPPVRVFTARLMNPRTFVIAVFVLGLLLAIMFTATALTTAELIMG